MTAEAMSGDRERCLAAGMDDYIAKPIRARDFYSVVESWDPRQTQRVPPAAQGGSGRGAPNGGRNGSSVRAPADSSAVFDMAGALARIGGSRDDLRELAGILAASAPALLDEARKALASGDAGELRRAAHTLKGSAAVFGAQASVDAALELETMARDGQLDGAPLAIGRLEGELQRLLVALRQALPEEPDGKK
jgi:HPt (histidine-containing phosphotransfer) domain-containing protein